MKVWITKYALTQGILEREAEVDPQFPSIVCCKNGDCGTEYFHGSSWHRTRKAAIARANAVRQSKIKTYKRFLAELEALKFE